MKPFTKLYSDFWINPDNTKLMQLGLDAQLMALYLQGNSHHNMLGVYYLPVLYVASDLKLSVKKVQTTLKKLCYISYCKYDAKTQYVWVCNVALEQLGVTAEDINAGDNRIKAIQAIWNSLPIQIDFLPEVYNKYNKIFNLKSRFDSLTVVSNEFVEPNLNVETPADTTDLKKEPSIDGYQPSIASAANLTTTFEGVAVNKESLQSPPVRDDSMEDNTKQKNYLSSITQSTTFSSTKNLPCHFATPSKGLANPSEAPSNPLQSPSEAPLEALRSNIEDRSNNIEEIGKKEKKETSNALLWSSTAQTLSFFEKPPAFLNSSHVKKLNQLEKTDSQQPIADESCMPISKLKTNSTPVDAAASSLPIIRNSTVPTTRNAVAPIVYNGAVINFYRAAEIIFEHWKRTMNYPEAKLDNDRRGWIFRALKNHTIEKLCEAITGCSRTPRNMGDNDRGECYNGLHVIFKDEDHIERFARNCHHPPKKETIAQKQLRESVDAGNEWIQIKNKQFCRSNYV
ncbi:conserved hypothetical protein [Gammaproteobacteria bacterium]